MQLYADIKKASAKEAQPGGLKEVQSVRTLRPRLVPGNRVGKASRAHDHTQRNLLARRASMWPCASNALPIAALQHFAHCPATSVEDQPTRVNRPLLARHRVPLLRGRSDIQIPPLLFIVMTLPPA